MRHHLLFISLFALPLPGTLTAATITWGAAQNVESVADISTTGSLSVAWNLGSTTSYTLNGVTFTGFNTRSGTADTGNYNITTNTGNISGQNFFGAYGTPVNSAGGSIGTDYGSALNTGVYVNGTATGVYTFSGLTVGNEYSLQLWFNDVRANATTGSATIDSGTGTPSVILLTDDEGLDGAGGRGALSQYTIGTFTADAASQSFRVNETTSLGGATLNMLQLRQVPEPGSALLGGLGLLALLRRRR